MNKKGLLLRIVASIETVYIFATSVFAAIMIYISKGSTSGVNTQGFTFYGTEYPMWVYGLASILFALIVFFYLCTLRIFKQ